jgi:hypothetical protein
MKSRRIHVMGVSGAGVTSLGRALMVTIDEARRMLA